MNDHQADKSINRSVEACQEGVVELKNHKEVLIPDGLRQELLSYIKRQGLTMGPVFISERGNPLDRSNITHMVNRRGKQAGLDPAKCNPRTGDTNNIALWLVLLIAGAAVATTGFAMKRRQR